MSGMGGPVGALNFHSGSSNVWYGVRGVSYGGIRNPGPGFSNRLDYITIQTTGNATSLGNTGTTRVAPAGLSGNGRGLFAGGREAPSNNQLTQIRYMTLISGSSTSVFGQLTTATRHSGGASDGLRGLYFGGFGGDGMIDYVTIASTGDAQDFGDLDGGGNGGAAGNNATRAVYANTYDDLEYVTIQTLGNSSDFGTLTQNRDDNCAATGDEATDRIVWGPGEGPSVAQKRMDTVTVSTTGNATEFGNLSFSSIKRGGLSDGTRGMWVGSSTPSYGDRIDYITISSSGSSSDFGDLSEGRYNPGCASGS
tara:strand:+ start:116 stop:1042 length:927 start_codon:yes stop_codon:yes gene_type:complete